MTRAEILRAAAGLMAELSPAEKLAFAWELSRVGVAGGRPVHTNLNRSTAPHERCPDPSYCACPCKGCGGPKPVPRG